VRKALAVAFAMVGLAACAGNAVAAPHVVVWSGGLLPGATAVGVDVAANGAARRMSSDADGHLRAQRSFAVRGAKLSRIAAAADAVLLHAPDVSANPRIADGGYVSVAVSDGATRRLVWDENSDPAQVTALLAALNAVLPRTGRLLGSTIPGLAASAEAHAAVAEMREPRSTAKCAPGERPLQATRNMSLQDAIAAGVVTQLAAKGVAGGDAMSVDASDPANATGSSVSFDIPVQVSSGEPGVSASEATEQVRQEAANDLDRTNLRVRGTDVNITYHFSPREAAEPAAPCVIQISVVNNPVGRGYTVISSDPSVPASMVLTSADLRTGGAVLQHEMGHAAFGLGDGYSSFWQPRDGSPAIPLPDGLAGPSLGAYLAANGIDPTSGRVEPVIDPEAIAKDDVMGDFTRVNANYTADALAPFIAGAGLYIFGKPGLILVPKIGSAQAFALAAPVKLFVPAGGSAHEDGLVAYCIDLLNHETPAPGTVYDVLSPSAGELGGTALSALQRVVDVVAARQPGPLEETPGANAAIWRVSDDASVDRDANPAAASILDAAGVPLDASQQTFGAPHFVDPAAGIPHTVALSSPTNATPLQLAPLPAVARTATLSSLTSARRVRVLHGHGRARKRTRALVVAWVTLLGKPDRVSLTLVRTRGQRTVTVARTRRQLLEVGATPLALPVRSPKPGRYRLVAHGTRGGTRTLSITVTAPPRQRRR
jgi:hypothetical protein